MTNDKQNGNGNGGELVLMVGSPASGKSTIRRARFSSLPAVDCDDIKAERADYDPKNPQVNHRWSSEEASRRALAFLSTGTSFVFDGTGGNVEKLSMFAQVARSTGMTVKAVFVTCSLETSLTRNAKRERVVADAIVREKYAAVQNAWPLIRTFVDQTQVIVTD
jgi:predicted kinase